MKPGPLSIVATLALVTAGCGDGPGGDSVAPDTPENATGREDGRAIADTSTPEANSRSDQVYILIDRTCAHGVSHRYIRFASDEAEKQYADIVEHVRMATLMLNDSLNPIRPEPTVH